MTLPRLLVIMGSGETAPTMKAPHRRVFERLAADGEHRDVLAATRVGPGRFVGDCFVGGCFGGGFVGGCFGGGFGGGCLVGGGFLGRGWCCFVGGRRRLCARVVVSTAGCENEDRCCGDRDESADSHGDSFGSWWPPL